MGIGVGCMLIGEAANSGEGNWQVFVNPWQECQLTIEDVIP
jgi:hypothetical protein